MSQVDESEFGDSVVEVEFRTTDSSYPLVDISERTGCTIVLEQLMPGRESGYYQYYQITGIAPSSFQDLVEKYDSLEARLVSANENDGVFEIRIADDNRFFAPLLTEAGALLTQLRTEDGEGHLHVEIPASTSVSEIIDLVVTNHPSMNVVARRQKEYGVPLFTQEQFKEEVYRQLSERQREILTAAYVGGYFEFPRKKTGEEIAAELGISAPTFSEHLRAVQRKIFSMLL